MISNESLSLSGYKQTEIGEIPEDWKLKTFGEIFDFKSTASNSRSDLTKSDSTHYIHYGDIHTVFHRHLNLEKRETPMISQELCKNASLVRNGDWVMADASEDYSGICKAIEISGISEEKSVVAGLHTFLLRDREGAYVPGFKGHLGEAKYLHDQYIRVSVGLKVFGVTKTSLRDLLIPVPSKSEQSRIEEILTDSDSQIQALELLISKKRDIKQGTIQNLLTKSDNWQYKAIGDIASKKKWSMTGGPFGSNLKSSHHTNYGVRIIQLQNIGDNIFIDKHTTFTSESKADELLPNNIFSGEIILSKMGDPVARGCLVPGIKERFVMCSDGIRLSVDEVNFDTNFVLLMINHNDFRKVAENASTGSTRKRIGLTELKSLEIKCPNFSEQQKIGNFIVNMDKEISALEKRLEKAKAIKKGMMQQLLTGRIRLVDSSTPQEARV